MKLLIVIPHYFRPSDPLAQNNSLKETARASRIRALTHVIALLHQTFGGKSFGLDHATSQAFQAAPTIGATTLDIIVCTNGDNHLLTHLPFTEPLYRRCTTNGDPRYLGFAAHRLMADLAGQYDYCGYLEDDVAINDPLFFRKRMLFDTTFGPEALLQPNRYEVAVGGPAYKLYPDYRLHERHTERFQDRTDRPLLTMDFLGEPIRFERTSYPSAGCFFLNQEQLSLWTRQPHFFDFDETYLSPLDSAATLSVMKTFRIYKPVLDQAWFLEAEHVSPRWVGDLGKGIALIPRLGLPESSIGHGPQNMGSRQGH